MIVILLKDIIRLLVASVLAVGLFLAVIALASIIFRQYFLTINVFNFDANHAWTNVAWYDGTNGEIANDEWKELEVGKFVPAGMFYFLLYCPEIPDLDEYRNPDFSPWIFADNHFGKCCDLFDYRLHQQEHLS